MTWRRKETAAQEALCARCCVREQHHKFPAVELKCKECKRKMKLQNFTSVAIKHWLNEDRHNNVATCFDCHYPPCSMPGCNKRPEHAVPWNSWVSRADFQKQTKMTPEELQMIFSDDVKRWFCGDCKYPKCQAKKAHDCKIARAADTKNRFCIWTC